MLIPYALCIISSLPSFDFYSNYLVKLYQLFLIKISLHDKGISERYSIEFYISLLFHHLCISSELKGEIEISYSKGKSISHARYSNIKEGPFQYANFTYKSICTRLTKENIVMLLNCIALERKLILIAENYGEISLIIEPLLAMLSPLEYLFTNISYLNKSMIDYVDSPQPYVIGMSRSTWDYYKSLNVYINDINVFDIDKGIFVWKESFAQFPSIEKIQLLKQFSGILTDQKASTDSKLKFSNYEKEDKLNDSWIMLTLHVHRIFFNFFIKLLKNFYDFYLEHPFTDSPLISAPSIFNFEKYLKQFKGEHALFLKELCSTQSFAVFIEKAKKAIDSTCNEKSNISWFIHYLKLRSDTLIKEEQSREISKIISMHQNPIQYKIEDIYALYEKAIMQTARRCVTDKANAEPLIAHKSIAKMPKISYSRFKKSIGLCKRPSSQIYVDLSLPITKNKRTEINTIMPFKTRQLDLSKMSSSKYSRNEQSQRAGYHNKENQSINNATEDEDIASEFNAHEISIAESLVSRSICKSKLVSPSPKKKISSHIDWMRIRSLTTMMDGAHKNNEEDTPPIRVSDASEYKKVLQISSSANLVEKKRKVLSEQVNKKGKVYK